MSDCYLSKPQVMSQFFLKKLASFIIYFRSIQSKIITIAGIRTDDLRNMSLLS